MSSPVPPQAAADRLAELGISIPQARETVISNIDSPHVIAALAASHGITHDMLAEIVGGNLTGLQVAQFFAARDISTSQLEELPESDTLDDATTQKLAELGVTRQEVRDFLFVKLDALQEVVSLANAHGVTGEMVADIMGGGVIGLQVAQMVKDGLDSLPDVPVILVGQDTITG